jgi:hypothetical protein
MNTIHNMKPGELSFEDIERVIQRARRMRSQALVDMGTTLRSFLRRRIHCALLYIRAAVSGNTAEKCA